MTADPVREAFEEWSKMFGLDLARRENHTGTYVSMHTHDAWCAYAAGRAAGLESAAEVATAAIGATRHEIVLAIRALAEGRHSQRGNYDADPRAT